MRLYYFTKAEHGLSNIALRRLKISQLDKLNDPFEWMAPALTLRRDRLALLETKAQKAKTSGLICFSKDWKDPVQWSHYADHHRGMCLGFEIRDDLPTEVTYERERQKIPDLTKFKLAGKMTAEWLKKEVICRKFIHWKYEQEYRVFTELDKDSIEDGNYFREFDQDMKLVSVFVGHNSKIPRKTIERALGDLKPHVSYFKARLAFQDFSVCEQQQDSLW